MKADAAFVSKRLKHRYRMVFVHDREGGVWQLISMLRSSDVRRAWDGDSEFGVIGRIRANENEALRRQIA